MLQFNCSKCYCACANHVIRHEDVCPLQHEGESGSFPVVMKSVKSIVRSEQLCDLLEVVQRLFCVGNMSAVKIKSLADRDESLWSRVA